MSHPNPTEDYCCEYWSEVDGEDGHEWCRAMVRKSGIIKPVQYGQCSCSGSKTECNCGMFMRQIIEDMEDR
jgi:hypothetical protein